MTQVRLSNILAKYSDRTTVLKREETAAYHAIQRAEGLAGVVKTFEKTDEAAADQDTKVTLVQTRVDELSRKFVEFMAALIDVTATKDHANTQASSDIVVDGKILVKSAPPTFLVSLEKQLTNLRTFFSKLPVLPADEDWHYDSNRNVHVSQPSKTSRTELVKEPLVLYPATDKHPAQTQIIENPKVVGTWTTTKFSGAVPATVKDELVERAQTVLDAVKKALHEANATVVDEQEPSKNLLTYIVGDRLSH